MTATTGCDPSTAPPAQVGSRTAPSPDPVPRALVGEARRDSTQPAGFWLIVSDGGHRPRRNGVGDPLFAPDSAMTYNNFGAAMACP